MTGSIWLTGLPSAGKSTLAYAFADRVRERHRVQVLDGDVVRATFFPELGFGEADRAANVRRIGAMAQMLAGHGVLVLVPVIAPYREARDHVRSAHDQAGIPFAEVFVDAGLPTCAARDVKGLYARAKRGEITGLTGFDAPYEEPENPELRLRTDQCSVNECLAAMDNLLADLGCA
ncbi:adenylyl-sulfate kinase [Kibdelosporangium phytohabitans]|uniref:Adenylyl-sulfate kinase n=1 Tax=Kibdelosporangium phytohabitans TaxID=860235 RepID=A0A0N9IDH2_9PSEU|nr:adenylyl-sulfate kinase [Kibdelosporangium phytohabitans]ALG13356.1 adenylylsulfate kinase [Kibdelosporangium phytohabitans]MBE1465142.1 adenylylsulfate kinase [Kibdelosporangium phytohabitans]